MSSVPEVEKCKFCELHSEIQGLKLHRELAQDSKESRKFHRRLEELMPRFLEIENHTCGCQDNSHCVDISSWTREWWSDL